MVFMVLGCAFLMVLGFEIFWEEFIGHWGEEREPEPGFMAFNRRALIFYVTFMTSGAQLLLYPTRKLFVTGDFYMSGTFVALGALTLWHARLINAGQTSIEVDFFYLNRDTLQLNLSNNHHKSFITFRHISIGQKQKGLQNWEEFIETRTISVRSTIGISFLALWMAGMYVPL